MSVVCPDTGCCGSSVVADSGQRLAVVWKSRQLNPPRFPGIPQGCGEDLRRFSALTVHEEDSGAISHRWT